MLKLILTAALGTVLVSPALANTHHVSRHSAASAHAHAGSAYYAFARGGRARHYVRPPGSGYSASRATVRPMESWDPYGLRWD